MWPLLLILLWRSGEGKSFISQPLTTSLWSQVRRSNTQSDLIVPSLCSLPCDRVFHAQRYGNTSDCLCECPEETPIFLQTLGQCIQRIEACARTVKFSESDIPVIELPKRLSKINFENKVLWKESGIKIKANSGARCNVTSVQYLSLDQSWIELSPDIIYPSWDKEAVFRWNGTASDNNLLEGSLVLVNLNCFGTLKDAHCLTFRVNGVLDNSSQEDEPKSNRAEIFIIILLITLLLLTIAGAVVLWNVCWKMKKNQLITGLQLQFLYRLKQEKDMAEAAQHYQALANAALNNEHQKEDQANPNRAHILAKRKLFFSPEFFEEEHMKSPPPMADQFLLDLRRMVKIARQRIQQQRHVPSLSTIKEEPPELFEPYMKMARKQEKTKAVVTEKEPAKLTDQVNSLNNNTIVNSSTDAAQETKENTVPSPEVQPPTIKRNKSQSRIPVNNKYKTKSPKLNPKFIIPTTSPVMDSPPPLPPRNPPPPIPSKYRSKESSPPDRYAIFPSELSLKKSLPRRNRKFDERVIANEV
ncbi:unnamed protein product [Bursaphelenchus okinawaensis]|uniref:Shavenoid isoform B-like N-terminal domain-containing protein n=1 Tax=Bursaphelenchus okinawaensis TaxID=465554 RepID=A0A811KVA3_9BILA|nr:unnamed protein product [Bursaphelenchus okinawaensis]CAG9112830.1 unnamed protein product [Bursaphelenchus okinawaensis]